MGLFYLIAAGLAFVAWAQWVHRRYDQALAEGTVPRWLYHMKCTVCHLGHVETPPDPRDTPSGGT